MASGDRPNTIRKLPGKKTVKLGQKEQSERFKKAARELEADESGVSFESAVEHVLRLRSTPQQGRGRPE